MKRKGKWLRTLLIFAVMGTFHSTVANAMEPAPQYIENAAAVLPKTEAGSHADTSNYHDGDVTAFKQILAEHPTLKSICGVDENDPMSWQAAGLVRWDDSTPKRLTALL